MINKYITPEQYKIAERNGMNKYTLERRVRQLGWNIDRALTQPTLRKNKTNWKEWKAVAKQHGVSYPTYCSRLRIGWTCEEAATNRPKTRREITIERWEKQGRRVTEEQIEVAKENGICYSTIHCRLHRGWSIEDAITKTPKQKHTPKERRKNENNI